jgi:hypothetical protein
MKTSDGFDQSVGDFIPGEWDRLLAEAESGGDSLDGEHVLAELREIRSRAADGTDRQTD